MNEQNQTDRKNIDDFFEKLSKETRLIGYYLNPDVEFTKALIGGLITNQKRYGYASCPCRLASGNKTEDLDIICPCDYRDQDIDEYGVCYCALYVSSAVFNGEKKAVSIPDRRMPAKKRSAGNAQTHAGIISSLPYPIWRCKVCGYLCAREHPPEVCPICRAEKERFEIFV